MEQDFKSLIFSKLLITEIEMLSIGLAGGRQMTDVNVAFIAQAYLVFSWTNDTEFFNQIYPFTKRATHWLIHRSTKGNQFIQTQYILEQVSNKLDAH